MLKNNNKLWKYNRLFLIFIINIAFLCISYGAFASTYYVSKSGSDTNTGAVSDPFLTIDKAVKSLSASGDEIWILTGDYDEPINVEDKSNITIKGVGAGVNVYGSASSPALKISEVVDSVIEGINFYEGKSSVVSVYRCDGTRIEDCTIGGGSTSSKYSTGINILTTPNFTLKNCTLDAYTFVGISLSNSSEVLLKGNDISNASSLLITFSKGCDYTTLEENYFHDKLFPGTAENGMIECRDNIGSKIVRNLVVGKNDGSYGSCIGVRGPYVACENITVENNTIIADGASAAINFAANTLSSTVKNNIIFGGKKSLSSGSGTKNSATSEVFVDYNLMYDYTLQKIDDVKVIFELGDNNIETDPLFEDTVDYKLSSDSPCIDAGDPSSVVPAGGGWVVDMGRYEYGASENSGPDIEVSKVWLNFATVEITQTKSLNLTISNEGTSDLIVSGLSVSGSSNFSVDSSSPSLPFTVTAGESTVIQVDYSPTDEDSETASLDISSNDSYTTVLSVLLSGNGTPLIEPDISLSKDSLDFGNVILGSSRTLNLTISNIGLDNLIVSDIVILGTQVFSLDELMPEIPFTITTGAFKTVPINFLPSLGTSNGSLVINSNDPDENVVLVNLSGTGISISQPDIYISPMSLDFGMITVGAMQTLTTTITNNGDADLTVSGLIITGNSVFSLNESTLETPFTISANNSVDLTVEYTPSGAGLHSSTIQITSNSPHELTSYVTITGIGTESAINVLPLLLDFGTVTVGSTRTLKATIINTGNTDLTVSELASFGSSDFNLNESVPETPLFIEPNSSVDIAIDYTPSGISLQSGTLQITCDDPYNPSMVVNLEGKLYEVLDLSISEFSVSKRVGLKNVTPLKIKLIIENKGIVEKASLANVVGVQNGIQIYNQSEELSGLDGESPAFSSYIPDIAGRIFWIASVYDENNYIEKKVATTDVYPKYIYNIKVHPNVTDVAVGEKKTLKASIRVKKKTKKKKGSAIRWYVNDIPGGNSTVGTITPKKKGKNAVYTVPSSVPTPSTVIVKIVDKNNKSRYGSSEITIKE